MDKGKVVLGIMAGALAGAAIGMLYAPHKGSKTRKKIFKKGNDTVDELKNKYDHLLDSMTDKLRLAKEDMKNHLHSRGKDAVNELTNKIG